MAAVSMDNDDDDDGVGPVDYLGCAVLVAVVGLI